MFEAVCIFILVAVFLATVAYYELKVVNLELQLAAVMDSPAPFNLVEYDRDVLEALAFEERVLKRNPYQRSTAYEAELMADINNVPDAKADGYAWPSNVNVLPFPQAEIEKYN